VQYGVLQSQSYGRPVDFQQYAEVPGPNDKVRWASAEQAFVVGFDLPAELFSSKDEENGGVMVQANIAYRSEVKPVETSSWRPTPFPVKAPDPASFKGLTISHVGVNIDVLGPDRYNLIPSPELSKGGNVTIERGLGSEYQSLLMIPSKSLDRLFPLPAERRRIYLRISPTSRFQIGASPESVRLFSPRLNRVLESLRAPDGKPAWPDFRGREMFGGQQMKGASDAGHADVGVFSFHGEPPAGADVVSAEFRVGIEGSSDDISGQDVPSRVVMEVFNPQTGATTPAADFPIESNRTAFFSIPAKAMSGGNFDVRVRAVAPGHYLILRRAAASPVMQLVVGRQPFAFNLFKSLLVMWLMSVLVVIISIFCSTFVSWPIAVVLTTVILLGHWGAQQIGDSNAPGLGAQIERDLLGAENPGMGKVVRESVDRLSLLLNTVSKVLPDISQFAATEDIERGVTIQPRVLMDSMKVILAFGLPMTVLAYVFLKRKEVAP
jgi:hypothetical protein